MLNAPGTALPTLLRLPIASVPFGGAEAVVSDAISRAKASSPKCSLFTVLWMPASDELISRFRDVDITIPDIHRYLIAL
jgi:hypothetical protein